jgi:hypothetical protein
MPAKRFKKTELSTTDLIVDAIYEGGRSGNAGDDPLHPLIGVSNQGGFRYLGSLTSPRLMLLTSNLNDPDWPDNLDRETGIFTYYGDNKHPGRSLHDTPRHGNQLLRNLYNVVHSNPSEREKVPPVLVFANAGAFRDVVFLGLAVPGASDLTPMEDLVAIWKIARNQRFQNYKASLTILDVAVVSRKWLDDIKSGDPLSKNCPYAWRNWVENGTYKSLKSEKTLEHRTRQEQIPSTSRQLELISNIYDYFKDSPISFEKCATEIVKLMDKNFHSFDITRPSRDGGRDAIGLYRIGHGVSGILIDLAVEAKCYHLNNAVGVREVSRLISRLRHRQFGVLVTTSFLHSQAYQELKDDKHPVIVIAANDIIDILAEAGINSIHDLKSWLISNFPK